MRTILAYLARHRRGLLLWGVTVAMFWVMKLLYGLPAEPFGYATALAAVLGGFALAAGYPGFRARCRLLELLPQDPQQADALLPPPQGGPGGLEGRYQAVLRALAQQAFLGQEERRAAHSDLLDYFTLWIHQIKTPIAAMHLLLQADGSRAELDAELFKIEQYAGMALSYLRLGGDSTDLLLEHTALDGVVRDTVHKLSALFILKRLTLEYEGATATVVTDRKWLGFILEQLLSNAIKYTPPGGRISITADAEALAVRDTGIGIRAEDLPRIFEKGYTGYNGREHQKSTGLGLYLCSMAARRLGCTLHAQSAPGAGTAVTLYFPQELALAE